jgi:crotonobetainyl-CoA:carnitine CoA-transferase CaiB-like acyl-CoA transferase
MTNQATDPMEDEAAATATATYLDGLRVLEIGEQLGEYAGRLLMGLGADVVRVEPPHGSPTRDLGPFLDDVPDREGSLYWWHYNLGKRSVTIDAETVEGRESLRLLVGSADVLLDSTPRGWLESSGLQPDRFGDDFASLLHLRITPFGDAGPWTDYAATDLVHLALGGVMMNCGYDPDPEGKYDTPPIAPQQWQAYQITGELGVMALLGALTWRLRTGLGQTIDLNVHQAVSMSTETDLPDWIYLAQPHHRLTSRHSMPGITAPALAQTKDGRYVMPYRTYLKAFASNWEANLNVLRKHGMQQDLESEKFTDEDYRLEPPIAEHINNVTDTLIARLTFDRDIWRDAQAQGLPWAPVRRPEENVTDEHWRQRGTFTEMLHPELGRTFTQVGSRWVCDQAPWVTGPRAPAIGEHTSEVFAQWVPRPAPTKEFHHRQARRPLATTRATAATGTPYALAGSRVIDLSWMLASAGAGRFLAGMGAEVIKVEHSSRWDSMRFGAGMTPPGGRPERAGAQAPIDTPIPVDADRSGNFMDINAGKLGISLNLKSPEGLKILKDLIRDADMVVEGFSPGTMDRMGLGYEELKKLNPDIIYVQQSGFGQRGTYGQARAFGPTAQAFAGTTEMSGLPSPWPPAGIGYSFLDWFGAYNMANAMLAALYRRDLTGEGCYIDTSQAEIGLYLTGTAVLDHSANGRPWQRSGNRSPQQPAAPHGAYPTSGQDRWIAIAVLDQQHWKALCGALELTDIVDDPRFADLEERLRHQDELDRLVGAATATRAGDDLMEDLQKLGIPAGVCQTAKDRLEDDPQLAFMGWMSELPQSTIGTWPVRNHPAVLSRTPMDSGGPFARSGPSYGEDNRLVLGSLLGLGSDSIDRLAEDGVL